MQSALSDIPIPSPSPADETSNKKSVSSEDDESSNHVPRIGVSKTRGRARHRNVKRGHRPLIIFNGTPESIAEFSLSSLVGYSSEDDEPMPRVRDRQESADMMGPVNVMQSALSDIPIPSPSPADETSNKKSVSPEDDESSDPVPGIGVSKTRGRARHRNVKRGHRPLFIFYGTPVYLCQTSR